MSTSDTINLPVTGMTCTGCAHSIEKRVSKLEGVTAVSVNFATREARVEGVPPGGVEAIASAIRDLGFGVETSPDAAPDDSASRWKSRFLLAAVLTLPIALEMIRPWVPGVREWSPRTVAWVLWVLATPVVMGAGFTFHRSAVMGWRHGIVDMNTLISVGTLTAYGYSTAALFSASLLEEGVYFDTAAVIITLVLMGRWLEAKARAHTGTALDGLVSLRPVRAFRMRGDAGEEVSPADLLPGDRIRVRPGEQFPTDGKVVEGESTVSEALLTGEPMPRAVEAGSEVLAGTVNGEGLLQVECLRVESESLLARIIKRVREAQGARAPIQRLADRVARVFVPTVIGAAVLTFLVWWLVVGADPGRALLPAVAVLIIACPCALGLATPAAIVVGTGAAARRGVLFRGGDVLEETGRIDTLILDKTGTVTQGRPRVVSWKTEAEGPQAGRELLAWAAGVEWGSEHPLGRAVLEAAAAEGAPVIAGAEFKSRPGRGVSARVNGSLVRVGTASWLEEEGLKLDGWASEALAVAKGGSTPLLVTRDERVAGLLVVEDPPREESLAAVRELQELGLELHLVSGDREEAARGVAASLGISRVQGGVLPEGKAEVVEALKREGKTVAMVGDGVNDAPALAAAHVGFAFGSGSDVAVETAPVALLGDDLRLVPAAIRTARSTLTAIRQNLFWAFAYNVVGIPLAAAGLLDPMVAAGAMAMSSVSVLLNSLRLRKLAP